MALPPPPPTPAAAGPPARCKSCRRQAEEVAVGTAEAGLARFFIELMAANVENGLPPSPAAVEQLLGVVGRLFSI